MRGLAFVLCLLGMSSSALADAWGVGTWMRRGDKLPIALNVQEAGAGRKLTWTFRLPDASGKETNHTMVVVTQLDGKDAPVVMDGKPTDETMAIRRIDANHAVTVTKRGGKQSGSSATKLSPDGKVMKVDGELLDSSGKSFSKTVEYWDRK